MTTGSDHRPMTLGRALKIILIAVLVLVVIAALFWATGSTH